MADELLETSDNPGADKDAVQRDRLKVDTRKWLLALPKIYEDKLNAEVTGKDGAPRLPQADKFEVARRLAFILADAVEQTDRRDGAARSGRPAEQAA